MNSLFTGHIYRHWIIDREGIERSYIGLTTKEKPENRWGRDGKGYRGQEKFWNAINEYSWECFEHEILATVEFENKNDLDFWLDQLEIHYIAKYDSYYNGYNNTLGGRGTKAYIPSNKAYFEQDLGGFYGLCIDKDFFEIINIKHIARIIYLATFMEYHTNRLVYVKLGKKSVPLTEQDIKRELGIDRRTYCDFRKEMTSNDILIFSDDGIYLTKKYFKKGKIKNNFIKIYINPIKELYSQVSARQHKTLGYLFKMMQYVNNEYYTFLNNSKKIITKKELADLLGLSINTYEKSEEQIKQLKITFRENSYCVLKLIKIKDNEKRGYVINPLIFGNDLNDYNTLESIFNGMLLKV